VSLCYIQRDLIQFPSYCMQEFNMHIGDYMYNYTIVKKAIELAM